MVGRLGFIFVIFFSSFKNDLINNVNDFLSKQLIDKQQNPESKVLQMNQNHFSVKNVGRND